MLLNFPPLRKMASQKNLEALDNLHNQNNENNALTQALSFVEMHSQAVLENLLVRTCHAYLAERGLV